MNFSNSKDERLLAFYDNVRRQVELEMRSGGRYRFVGDSVKQYADKLREEMERRRLRFTPIDWNLASLSRLIGGVKQGKSKNAGPRTWT